MDLQTKLNKGKYYEEIYKINAFGRWRTELLGGYGAEC